jgi:hypothetical protein
MEWIGLEVFNKWLLGLKDIGVRGGDNKFKKIIENWRWCILDRWVGGDNIRFRGIESLIKLGIILIKIIIIRIVGWFGIIRLI